MLREHVAAREVIDADEIELAAGGEGANVPVDEDHRNTRLPQAFRDAAVGRFAIRLMFKRNKKDSGHAFLDETGAKFLRLLHCHFRLADGRRASSPPEPVVVDTGKAGQLATDVFENFRLPQAGHDHAKLRARRAEFAGPVITGSDIRA